MFIKVIIEKKANEIKLLQRYVTLNEIWTIKSNNKQIFSKLKEKFYRKQIFIKRKKYISSKIGTGLHKKHKTFLLKVIKFVENKDNNIQK